MRFRDRIEAAKAVNIQVVTNSDEVVKLRAALARIAESAKDSEGACRHAADILPYRYSKLAEGFTNLASHFSYIRKITKEATNDGQ